MKMEEYYYFFDNSACIPIIYVSVILCVIKMYVNKSILLFYI